MRIRFTFSGKSAEEWQFRDPKQELMIFITNPFKIGIGFKYREVNTRLFKIGGFIDENGNIAETLIYHEGFIKAFRFWKHPKLKHFTKTFNTINIQTRAEKRKNL